MSYIIRTHTEEWRDVLGYEGVYQVSDQGRVRSLPRLVTRRNGRNYADPGRVLKVWLIHGYPMVNLGWRGAHNRRAVHILVCEAWHGPRPAGQYARHLDDVPTNVHPGNLAWGTPLENSADATRNRRNAFANKTHCPQGHPYSAENTYQNSKGHRQCRTCQNRHSRDLRARRRAAREGEVA